MDFEVFYEPEDEPGDEPDYEIAPYTQFEEDNVKKELVTNSQSTDDDDNTYGLAKIQAVLDAVKMVPKRKKNEHPLNIETSDASLVFPIIDLLQSNPTLWFIGGPKSEAYRKGLRNLHAKFCEIYEFAITQKELNESLIEFRDWYHQVFEQKSSDQLSYPQSEYYRRLVKFLPDKLSGKTCESCDRIFEDHVQYFTHRKLEHGKATPDDDKESEEVSLEFLKECASDYFHARYSCYPAGHLYECQICVKTYNRRNACIEHIRTHLGIRNHICPICGKTFIKKQNFAAHKRRHLGLKRWKCLICGKAFKTCTSLTDHRKRHHVPIEGTIEEIEEKLKPYYWLKRRKHSEDYVPFTDGCRRRYACPFCEKTFASKHGAQKHNKKFHKKPMLAKNGSVKTEQTSMDTTSDVEFYLNML